MDEMENTTKESMAGEEQAENAAGRDSSEEAAGQEAGKAGENPAAGTQEKGEGPAGGLTGSQEKETSQEESQDPEGEAGREDPHTAKAAQIGQDPESREEEIRKREENLARRELELDTKAILKEKGISESMLPFLIREDKEETEKCITAYKAAADAELKARLDERLVGKTPPQPAGRVTKGDQTISDVFASALRG